MFTWAIKQQYGGVKYFRHAEHGPPQPWHLTTSKLAQVYEAQHNAEVAVDGLTIVPGEDPEDEIRGILDGLIEEITQVADEYREAAEAMGGAGAENEERADILEAAVDELESFSLATEAPEAEDDDCDTCGGTGTTDESDVCPTCNGDRQVESDEIAPDDWDQYVEDVKAEVHELIGSIELP